MRISEGIANPNNKQTNPIRIKQLLRSLPIIAAALTLTTTAWGATEATIDGINYSLTTSSKGNSAKVDKTPGASGDITIPATVTYDGVDYEVSSIGNEAFRDCTGLTSVSISDGITAIQEGAFLNCSALESISIPTTVTSISNNIFVKCTSLTSITIPEGVTNLGNYVFSGCTALTTVSLPSTLKGMGDNSFNDCTVLTNLTVADGNEHFAVQDGALYEQTDGVLTRLVFVLADAEGEFVIPSTVTEIAPRAFSGATGVTSIFVPKSVTKIGDSSLKGTALAKVTFESSTPASLHKYAVSSTTSLRVPYDALDAYKEAWGDKYSYVELPKFTAGDNISIESYVYDEDEAEAKVTVSIAYGYEFGGVSISGDDATAVKARCSTSGVVTISGVTGKTYVISAKSMGVTFTSNDEAKGTVSAEWTANDAATVTLTPATGYAFTKATSDGLEFALTPDADGKATIEEIMSGEAFVFTFSDIASLATYEAGTNGTIETEFSGTTAVVTVKPNSESVYAGAEKNSSTLSLEPDADGKITITGVSATDAYLFTFVAASDAATFTAGEHGSIVGDVACTALSATTISATMTIAAEDGYEYDTVSSTSTGFEVSIEGDQLTIEGAKAGSEFTILFKEKTKPTVVPDIRRGGDATDGIYDLTGRKVKGEGGVPRGMHIVIRGGEARKVIRK